MRLSESVEEYITRNLRWGLTRNAYALQWAKAVFNLSERDLDSWEVGYVSDPHLSLGPGTVSDLFSIFLDRFILPIRREDGCLVGWVGRGREKTDGPPYLFPPGFSKTVLYGLHKVRCRVMLLNLAVVVEGFTDVMHLQRLGVPAVAVMGITFSKAQAVRLRRYCDKVLLIPDGDEAGIDARDKWVKVCREAMFKEVVWIQPPDGHDPRSWIESSDFANFISAVNDVMKVLRRTEVSVD